MATGKKTDWPRPRVVFRLLEHYFFAKIFDLWGRNFDLRLPVERQLASPLLLALCEIIATNESDLLWSIDSLRLKTRDGLLLHPVRLQRRL